MPLDSIAYDDLLLMFLVVALSCLWHDILHMTCLRCTILCMHLSDALISCGMAVNRPGRFNRGLPRFSLDASMRVV